jgi:hypothetical protein
MMDLPWMIFDDRAPVDRVLFVTPEVLERVAAEQWTAAYEPHRHVVHPARPDVCIDCGAHAPD